ncbi:putative phosphatidate phosphatase [Diabrotica virgifera virgifera]|uniref:Phosphatidate phosphatase n=1 Tax=Diabrotica virgifera virgifera TaxID=50390 RepID=A0A6P7FN35_DIAVI|nr:putative phosphatidate phosphatase [Diabrotica virgifera virgifera]
MANSGNETIVRIEKVLLDIFLMNCVGWPILFLYCWGSAYRRGVFCDDESIRHPFLPSTVPSWTLYITGFGLNILAMSVTEYLNRPTVPRNIVFLGFHIPNWFYNLYCTFGIFAFGAACSQLTTDVLKYTVGRLRPHFITVCAPNVCNGSFIPYKYYENFTCTNPLYIHDKRIMKEMRLSFPSGHSSFSMYSMLYFAIYLQRRMTWDGSKLLKHTLQFLAVLSSLFTAMTRVSDYKHHWSDVLCGLTLGATVSIITAKFFSNLFNPTKELKKSEPSELSALNGNNRTHV